MPIVQSTYKAPYFFRKGFVSTVYSGLFRNVNGLQQERERIELTDGDFLDLDWSFAKAKTNKLIIVLHGLEGNAQRPYMTGTAKLFTENNIDAVCVNFRGCSGEPNRKYYSYHSGATQDLHEVVQHIIESKHYSEIYIKGFSLGGNVTLKYLGERDNVPSQIKAGIAVSVPCFLKGFDNVYTSKAHGFIDAQDYYEKSSSLQFLNNIQTPTLIINALNDSFLSPECYPVKEAKNNSNLHLEMPNYGGHVGFVKLNKFYYNETRALNFITNI